ncbi:MAG: DUF6442 family protein [Peptoniphilus sp.]|uniref:Uncharacterized protein n=2 Tax=Peptoniphilus indolicus TaxID=33030 RepID=G4D760_9FIRM|nr:MULTISPECIES: DUF6442 family protein [Peptoniphilus]EGY76262.1 hypothetical protein HMPREF9129_2240 [Peptoniphilus indolicus ATCC 29427]MDY2987867.1 DUF6442 family protein [Peptoniphilus sp.]SUB75836.1 Uncharacterised protein [Peptoniphilus indolicus]
MNKDEVLNKYKKENTFGDERERSLKLKSYELGTIFASIAFIIVWIVGRYKNLDISQATFVFMATIVGRFVSKLYNKNYSGNFEKTSYILVIVGGLILFFSQIVDWLR